MRFAQLREDDAAAAEASEEEEEPLSSQVPEPESKVESTTTVIQAREAVVWSKPVATALSQIECADGGASWGQISSSSSSDEDVENDDRHNRHNRRKYIRWRELEAFLRSGKADHNWIVPASLINNSRRQAAVAELVAVTHALWEAHLREAGLSGGASSPRYNRLPESIVGEMLEELLEREASPAKPSERRQHKSANGAP